MPADGNPEEPPVIVDEIYTWLAFETASASTGLTFVIVEGGLDRRVYRKILDDANRCIILTNPEIGRELIKSAFPLNDVYRTRTLAIIDKDFDYALLSRSYEEGLIVTPTHDVETLVLSTPAFENLLDACVDPGDRAAFEEQCKKTIIAAILHAARPIGLLRLHNAQRTDRGEAGMNFKDDDTGMIPYGDYVGAVDFSLDLPGLIEWVFYNTDHRDFKSMPRGEVLAAVAELDPQYPDNWLVCQGHDLVGLIALGLKEHFDNRDDDLEAIINDLNGRLTDRAILRAEYLHGSLLCDSILEWEETHPPFRVLRDAARASCTSPSRIEGSG